MADNTCIEERLPKDGAPIAVRSFAIRLIGRRFYWDFYDMKLAVIREMGNGERRVSATHDTVKKFIQLGATVCIETGAGINASIADASYVEAGAIIGDRAAVIADADIVLAI
jgi:hypothetical protein